MERAVTDKTIVHRAMYRNGLSWVDFVWGSEGRVTESGKGRGAMGISHIFEARQRKDGMSEQQVHRLLDDIVQTIARGEEIRRQELDGYTRAIIEHGNVEATLVRSKGSNAWLLNGWRVDPGAAKAANDTLGTTHIRADSSDARVGAGSLVPDANRRAERQAADTQRDTSESGSPLGAEDGANVPASAPRSNVSDTNQKHPGTTDFETIRDRVVPSYARSDTGGVEIVRPDGADRQFPRNGSNILRDPAAGGDALSMPDDHGFAETERAYGGREAYSRAKADGRTKLSYGQWVQVRTPNFKRWFGDWELAGLHNSLRDATGSDLARKAAAEFIGVPLRNPESGIEAVVSNGTLGKMMSQSAVQNSISPQAHMMCGCEPGQAVSAGASTFVS